MSRGIIIAGLGLAAAALLTPSIAQADPPCGHGWRKHEYCGGYGYRYRHYPPPPVVYYQRPGVVYARPGVVYAPPPVVYAPPPVVYAAPPPVVYAPPMVSLGVNIPLR